MRAWLGASLVLLLHGCGGCGGEGDPEDSGAPDTGLGETALVVTIVGEDGVQKSADALEVEVRIAADRAGLDVAPARDTATDDAPVAWPGMVRAVPAAGEDSAFVEVAVRVTMDGSTYARAKIRTQFVPTLTLEATLVLDDLCPGVECLGSETCVDGDCEDAFVDPTTLIPSRRDGGTDPDASFSDVPGVDAALPPTCPPHPPVVRVDAGNRHTCAILEGGALYCFGSGEDGRTGLGDMFVHNSPTRVGAMTFSEVTAAARHTCAVATDGVMWCWGFNSDGQVGDGTMASRLLPTQVARRMEKELAGITVTWTSAGAGALAACGLDMGGVLRCWGDNAFGQLALGDTSDRSVPEGEMTLVPVEMPREWTMLAVGARHACAYEPETETVQCWGDNATEQLGVGDTMPRSAPVQTGAMRMSPRMISAGDGHTCAIEAAGELFCWGANEAGQLGRGTTSVSGPPERVMPASNFTRVAAGLAHTCAIDIGGELFCWGEGGEGQLGQGNTMSSPTPVAVAGDGWTQVTVAMGHTCAIGAEGRLWCWGRGLEGQLGQGDTLPQRRPHEVCF